MIDNKELEEARASLEKFTGLYVGSGWGYPNRDLTEPLEHFLIIWLHSNEVVNAPKEYKGFKVVVRKIPKAL